MELRKNMTIIRKGKLLIVLWTLLLLAACTNGSQNGTGNATELIYDHSLALSYAEQFSVDYYKEGYKTITIADTDRYLIVPRGKSVPQNTQGMIVIKEPVDNIYMVSSSAMDLVRAVNGLDRVKMTGTKENDWYIEEIKTAMSRGDILYAGKYSAPDYEMVLANHCGLAVENTMIYHKPEVKEKIEELGIPVLVEYSSMETHPLGRVEWIKLYGVLLDKEEEAEAYFNKEINSLSGVIDREKTDKTVVYFYITASGSVNVRKSGDYVSKMIELAGGRYLFDHLTDDNALSTMNIQMEQFIESAMEADYLVYNSSIDGKLSGMEDLLQKCPELKNAKAVREKNVWCTEKNMFQETTGIAEMILDFHYMMTGEDWNFKYMFRLED